MLRKICLRLLFQPSSRKLARKPRPADEGGWALLSLILALTILGIALTSSIQPNYQLSVQREKETELFYRGQQMAEGIVKYYNNDRLTPQSVINLGFPPAYGYLKELKKLKEGVTINLREVKFVRASAMIDPFDGEEWEPVYARDPRIAPFLQAWALETGGIIPQQWLQIAGPPPKMQLVKPKEGGATGTTGSLGGSTGTAGNPAGNSTGIGSPGSTGSQPGSTTGQQRGNQPNRDPDDDDDDDDDDSNDPLAHLFTGSSSGLPIVGVAPRRKGPTVRSLYGLKNYEEWVFIYLPTSLRIPNTPNQNQGGQQNGRPPLQVNQ